MLHISIRCDLLYDVCNIVDEIKKLFPNLFGQPSAMVVAGDSGKGEESLKIGVVLSGGQAPGGHNVICGIFGECLYY